MLQKIKWAGDLLAAILGRKREDSLIRVSETETAYHSRPKMDPTRPRRSIPHDEWARMTRKIPKGK